MNAYDGECAYQQSTHNTPRRLAGNMYNEQHYIHKREADQGDPNHYDPSERATIERFRSSITAQSEKLAVVTLESEGVCRRLESHFSLSLLTC